MATIKMFGEDKELEHGEFEIWCDNSLPTEATIIKRNGETSDCWLVKAEYVIALDMYKAIYKSYTQE